jgi:AraC family transcriptional regulator, regulatory protein of adaptative response / methylated-DNA-[protein]-cysteine methyltransferase
MSHYELIAKVIEYICDNPQSNHNLEEIADFAGVSSFHLQKVFSEFAGVSPKQFSRYLTLGYAKELLSQYNNNLQTTVISGLSSTGRLHDLFVDIEAMTPFEFQNHGQNLTINYSVHDSEFGYYVIGSTKRGVCSVLFLEDSGDAISELTQRWPNAKIVLQQDEFHESIIEFFNNQNPSKKIKLLLGGTNFQIKVWEALLTIPEGTITSYGKIATKLGDPNSSRAVGTAIGDNPIGYIIPCHRVLKSTGQISGYRWGQTRKKAILGYEASKTHSNNVNF